MILIVFALLSAAFARPEAPEWSNYKTTASKPQDFPAIYSPLGPAYAKVEWANIAVVIPIEEIIRMAEEEILFTLIDTHWSNIGAGAPEFRYKPLLDAQAAQLNKTIQAVKSESQAIRQRQTREVNLNLDIPNMVEQVFNGFSNLINAPTLRKVEAKVQNLVQVVKNSVRFQAILANSVKHLESEWNEIKRSEEGLRIAFYAWTRMEEAKDILHGLAEAANDLSSNKMSSSVVLPGEATQFLAAARKFANARGLHVPLISIFEFYNLPTSFYASENDWTLIIHCPMINHRDALTAYEFLPFPAFVNKTPLTINHVPGLVAISTGLPEDTVSIFVEDFSDKCLKLSDTYICEAAVVHRQIEDNCPAQTLMGLPSNCTLTEVTEEPQPRWSGGLLLAFFFKNTDVAVTCAGEQPKLYPDQVGRTNISLSTGCTATTNRWTFSAPFKHEKEDHFEVKLASFTLPERQNMSTSDERKLDLRPDLQVLQDVDTQLEQDLRDLEELVQDTIEADSDVIEWTSIALNSSCTFIIVSILLVLIWRACKAPTL